MVLLLFYYELKLHLQNNYGVFLCRQKKYTEAIIHFLLATKDPAYLHVSDAYQNAAHCALKIPNRALADQYAAYSDARRLGP